MLKVSCYPPMVHSMRTETRPAPATPPAPARRASDFSDCWDDEPTCQERYITMSELVYGKRDEARQ